MTTKEKECVFTIYERNAVNNNFQGRAIGYGTLLKKCTCDHCMEEKEGKKRMEERNDSSKTSNKKD